MPEVKRLYHRQELLRIDKDTELHCHPEERTIIRNWLAAGFPVIVRRPGTRLEGLHCGIPLPLSGGFRRIPLRVEQLSVQERLALPRLQDCLADLPAACRPINEKLLSLNPELFGSVAWQHLTGQTYVHEKSDLDLLLRVRNPQELRKLLRTLPSLVAPSCDLEIMLWNQRAFSWREWNSGADYLLLKSDQRVFLHPRNLLTGTLPTPHEIAAAACEALFEELETYPKPGLVSYIDNGSHTDMNATHFAAAIEVLTKFFAELAEAGAQRENFAALQKIGLAAEAKMLLATAGVNTHRGAIFSIGLLCAAAGRKFASGSQLSLGEIVVECWAKDILRSRNPGSHGDEVKRKYGVGGAAAEAAAGFFSVYQYALPELALRVKRNDARIQAFYTLLKVVDDTTLLYRGGAEGRKFAAMAAAKFLGDGGVDCPDWETKAALIHYEFTRRGLSCGGIADLLAAALFIQQMEEIWLV